MPEPKLHSANLDNLFVFEGQAIAHFMPYNRRVRKDLRKGLKVFGVNGVIGDLTKYAALKIT